MIDKINNLDLLDLDHSFTRNIKEYAEKPFGSNEPIMDYNVPLKEYINYANQENQDSIALVRNEEISAIMAFQYNKLINILKDNQITQILCKDFQKYYDNECIYIAFFSRNFKSRFSQKGDGRLLMDAIKYIARDVLKVSLLCLEADGQDTDKLACYYEQLGFKRCTLEYTDNSWKDENGNPGKLIFMVQYI
jgi:hypothetical protein